MIDFKYRPDVDGLRMVAVTLVLLFHAGLGFSGGFIGVDVFFVISGFLITGLILKEQDAGKFSLANFWVRRIRRIIPAATVMVVTVLVAGFFLLLPTDYADLGKSTVAQQLMLSNVYFWRNTGYFDGPSDLKPLLHTWSLAVEEQFYLGYPFLLMVLYRYGRRVTIITLALLGIGSLAISEFGVRHHPCAAFFLLPTRAWELIIGGLICFLPNPTRIPSWLLALCSWLSLATILGAGWFYTSTTPFPGFTALVPSVATAALIYANSIRLSVPAAVLATKPAVFIGLLSYSLYLWHWPILAFVRYWLGIELSIWIGVCCIILSLVLAYLSWAIVETPFRRPKKEVCWRSLVLVSSAACCVLGLSVAVVSTRGARFRLPMSVVKFDVTNEGGVSKEFGSRLADARSGNLPHIGTPVENPDKLDFVVWGDSHARMIAETCDRLAQEKNVTGVVAAKSSTPPFLRFGNERSQEWNRLILDLAISKKCKNVLLVSRWQFYFRPGGSGQKRLALFQTIESLHHAGLQVWVLAQVPTQVKNYNPEIARSALFNKRFPTGVLKSEFRDADKEVRATFRKLETAGVRIIWVEETCFGSDGKSLLCDEVGSFYWDDNHLSAHGVEVLLSPHLRCFFDELESKAKEN